MTRLQTYKVTALKLGTLGVDKAAMTYMSGFGSKINLPVWAAAVEGNGVKMLVDTGIRDHDKWDRELNPCWAERDETIETALAEIGWSLSDVDVVINSHLHYDHAENNTSFRNARFVVSRVEWEYAKNPIPSQTKLYDFEWTDESVDYLDYQLISVDDYDVLPGVRLIQTPGHSKGHQSVVIQTEEGTLCVAGDAACLPESFWRPAPPGGATSIEEGFASLERIRESAQRVLMNHDPNISKYQDSNFPMIPAIGSGPLPGSIETLPGRGTGAAETA
ncbi:N-acyl homoserine lactonase family protein [Solwaraspora sp. WMMD406]|uniref:N-acyl homoserine lactonase family protein n=1 Tax=Solwaraspora sp. WMMD406 TaxID=3016095 RepID=UPI0024174BBD|nr:N-acyl homoserine lactonase family protein [Solwaraspora sp. WMMD406]MDG4767999.1 N-acyl homoserine lactonase family protein [Solwaraspora sp. WMMD406]